MIRPQTRGIFHNVGQLLQIRQGILIILLRGLVEKDPPNS